MTGREGRWRAGVQPWNRSMNLGPPAGRRGVNLKPLPNLRLEIWRKVLRPALAALCISPSRIASAVWRKRWSCGAGLCPVLHVLKPHAQSETLKPAKL